MNTKTQKKLGTMIMIIGFLLAIIRTIVYQFAHIDETEARVFINNWPSILIGVILIYLGSYIYRKA